MKAIILADIHGNLPALTAVLDKFVSSDLIICAGDITGYGPYPNEVIDLLLERQAICILGNHGLYLLEQDVWHSNPLIRESVKNTMSLITPTNLHRLSQMPKETKLYLEGREVLVVHGSPWNPIEEYIYPNFRNFYRFLDVSENLIIMGHTHYSMLKRIGRKTLLNPGSCGQARDQRGKSCFAVCNTTNRTISLEAIDYPKEITISQINKLGWSSQFSNLLDSGYK